MSTKNKISVGAIIIDPYLSNSFPSTTKFDVYVQDMKRLSYFKNDVGEVLIFMIY